MTTSRSAALWLAVAVAGCASADDEVRHLSVSIDRAPADVYAFCADPQNLPHWAEGLAGSVRVENDVVIASSPIGDVRVKFASRNDLGVLDHDVTLPSGETIHNPMRVLPHRGGSEVVFSLFRRPGVSAQEFARDAAAVTRDLNSLKRLLER
jgi:hypothetical protein